jgi:TnpA family transposase
MNLEISKQNNISSIYHNVCSITDKFGISRQNILYYSSLAEYYSIFSLSRMKIEKARIYLICYVLQRFWKINDHLISYFLYKTNCYQDEAKKYAINKIYQAKVDHDQDTKKAAKILSIIANEKVDDNQIRTESFKIVEKDKFNKLIKNLSKPKFKDLPYIIGYYNKNYHAIRLNLRSIFLSLNFTYEKNTPIKSAITFFQNFLNSKKIRLEDYDINKVPLDFLPKKIKSYIIKTKIVEDLQDDQQSKNGKINKTKKHKKIIKYVDSHLYESVLYLEIQKYIGSLIFISDSENYRSLEDELIPLQVWNEQKDQLIQSLPNCIISTPIDQILETLESKLEPLYLDLNQKIKSGENKHIKINAQDSSWKLSYQKQEEEVNNPFFDYLPTLDLSDCLMFVAKKTNFHKHFSHILSKNIKTMPKLEHLNAYLIALGTGIGIGKMAESSDVTKANLELIEQNYIRLETLKNANDQIINAIAGLGIFKHYNLSEYGIIGSVDGQKLQTKSQTIKARYSRKYFGGAMGVVAYSLIANHVPINSMIIGANDHESHYILDIFLNNSSNIKPIAISGDMHSINRFNSALLYLFKCQFMPRFTRIFKSSTKNLASFKESKLYEGFLIKPSNKIEKPFIRNNWDAICRIIVSLAKKHTSQHIIIKKLSAQKNNSTLMALAQFDSIIMSLYMLNYINDIKLRQMVQKSLNRGESFHQLRSALMKISGKHIQGKTEFELLISNECNRLLANAIIFYHCLLLSSLLAIIDKHKNKKLHTLITKLSPVAWKQINMIGKFKFLDPDNSIDIESIIDKIMQEFIKKSKQKNNKKS